MTRELIIMIKEEKVEKLGYCHHLKDGDLLISKDNSILKGRSNLVP